MFVDVGLLHGSSLRELLQLIKVTGDEGFFFGAGPALDLLLAAVCFFVRWMLF
jgi:hypothetical protein